jgi:hypothetical protein
MEYVDYLWVKAIVLCVLAFFYGMWTEYVRGKPPKAERRDKE